jgi:flavin-dependent dehydrogenase
MMDTQTIDYAISGAPEASKTPSASPQLRLATQLASCDVLVIGGGPAGSTVATLLAERGYNVVLMEKAHHPRFHIGESLLPLNMPLLEKLGVRAEVEAHGMIKHGVEFVSPWHGNKSVFLEFKDAWDKEYPHAYQVRRSEFDHTLIKNAAAKGANIIEGCRVRKVHFDNTGSGATVCGSLDSGEELQYTTKFVIDASGRDTFLANQFDIKEKNSKHASAAVYGHFKGAKRLEGRLEGNITVFWFDHGWFWFIPLADGTTSIGAVCWPYYLKSRKKPPNEFLMDTIAMCPQLADRLKDAELLGDASATGNYSYKATRSNGKNYLMLGDAFAFIDPVFSSGVFLAMNSGFVGADAVDACLRNPAEAPAALKKFEKVMRDGPQIFSWFIYRLTSPSMRDLFMSPQNKWRVQEAVLSVLAGDIFRGTPINGRLYLFRCIYYITSLFNLKQNWAAWRRRKRNVAETVPSTMVTNS